MKIRIGGICALALLVGLLLSLTPSGLTTSAGKPSPEDLRRNLALDPPVTVQDLHLGPPGGNLRFLGQVGGATSDIATLGTRAYAPFGPRLAILDVSNPANITRIGQTTPFLGDLVQGIAIKPDAGYAYVAAGTAGLFSISALPAVPRWWALCP